MFGARLRFDTGKNTLSLHTTTVSTPAVPFEPISLSGSQTLSLRIIADLTGVEIYLGRGTAWISQGHCADPNLAQLRISAEGGTVAIQNLTISELTGIWNSNRA